MRSELVFSALAVQHLDGPGKADLFARVAAVLSPGGRFGLADVVVPDDAITRSAPTSTCPAASTSLIFRAHRADERRLSEEGQA